LSNSQQIKNSYRNERGPISGLLSAAFWFSHFVWLVLFVVKMLRLWFFHFLAFAGWVEHQLDLLEFGREKGLTNSALVFDSTKSKRVVGGM
jgi:hypothetical protein